MGYTHPLDAPPATTEWRYEMSEQKTVPVEPTEADLADWHETLAAAPSAEPVTQGGETNAATQVANAESSHVNQASPVSEAGNPALAAPTLPTIEWIEAVSGMAYKCDVGGEALVKLCNAARIGLQCLQAEPVAWMVHHGEIWNTKTSPYKDEIGKPLIVQPEVRK